jgi:hypothetical protein
MAREKARDKPPPAFEKKILTTFHKASLHLTGVGYTDFTERREAGGENGQSGHGMPVH